MSDTVTRFPDIAAFYAMDERRERSGEMDFGVWWSDRERSGPPNHRVSVVADMGEVYAINMTDGTVELIGTIVVNTEPGIVSADDRWGPSNAVYKQAEKVVLRGWVDHIHTPRSLEWVRQRVRSQ
jgi:hypothetical protein